MNAATQRAVASILIIAIGYAFKRFGIFKQNDYKIAAVMSLNITLPAAIITSFATFERDSSLYAVVLLGLCCNLLMLGLAWFATRRREPAERVLPLFCLPGYVIGVFTLPYVGGILGPYAMIVTCMFDIGNSIMSAGGTYAFVSSLLFKNAGERMTAVSLIKKLTATVPFDIYMAALLWSLLDMKVPEAVVGFIAPIASANYFVSMLMIGMMIDMSRLGRRMKEISAALALRYAAAALLSYLLYNFAPFSLEIRQVLAVVVLSPISALASIFTEKCGGDYGTASLAGSISIMLSVVFMTVCFTLMGI